MNVLTMPQHLGHSDLPLATMLSPAGFVICLTHLCDLIAVTTSARFWKDCSTLEQMQRRYLKMEVSAVFTIGFTVFLVLLTCIFVSSEILLSAFFSRASTLFFRTSNAKPFRLSLPCRALVNIYRITCGIPSGIALSRADKRRNRSTRRRNRIGPNCTLLSFCP